MANIYTNTNLFITKLNVPQDTRIIALSDIHSDIDALIIALRDCAKVIKSNNNIPNFSIPNGNQRDLQLDKLLKLDLNNNADATLFDLNHELTFSWIGGNTHIVIVGDIIDGKRENYTTKTVAIQKSTGTQIFRNANDIYPQAEIKILCFLNKLDELASIYGGRVIKLLGNHDCLNFISPNQYAANYSHDENEIIKYPPGSIPLTRAQYFNINNPGFKLFTKQGVGITIKINNNLFMHGQIDPTYNINICEGINNWLNSVNYNGDIDLSQQSVQNSPSNLFLYGIANGNVSRLLWNREYGDTNTVNERIMNGTTDAFCQSVVQDIRSFLNDPNLTDIDINNMKVIIGHCFQYDATQLNKINNTYITQRQDNNVVELSPPSTTTRPDFVNNNIFGITMECKNPDPDPTHKIYKVDIGTSRAFDDNISYTNTGDFNNRLSHSHMSLKQRFLSRVPQVLQIINNDIRIIRSTFQNTRIHQPRPLLENLINTDLSSGILTPDFKIENMTYGGYKEKYLKYKKKYFELKKNL